MARVLTTKRSTKPHANEHDDIVELFLSGGYTLAEIRDAAKQMSKADAAEVRRAIADLTPSERTKLEAPRRSKATAPVAKSVAPKPSSESNGGALADILVSLRGDMTTADFAKKLGLSYTFTREMTRGNRFPSDDVLERIAARCRTPLVELVIAAYTDRSALLREGLRKRGIVAKGGRSTLR